MPPSGKLLESSDSAIQTFIGVDGVFQDSGFTSCACSLQVDGLMIIYEKPVNSGFAGVTAGGATSIRCLDVAGFVLLMQLLL